MTIIFYPHEDEMAVSTIDQKLELLLDAAERYKAAVLDVALKGQEVNLPEMTRSRMAPRDITHSYNWEEIARILQDIRNMPESTSTHKINKAEKLTRLAEVYEVLRGAKMAKLEAVRLALMNEAKQLRGSQVA